MREPPAAEISTARLDYDAVIATRNRPEALALSIPLLIAQTRPPKKLVVVDSSDDHAPVAETVARATSGWNGEVIVEHSPKGLPLQRNRGLVHVTAPVVLFPDDDSLLYPDAAEHILAVYERDTEEAIAAVCALEEMNPPDTAVPASYSVSAEEARKRSVRGLQSRVERRVSWLKPAKTLGRTLNEKHSVPEWLRELDARPVEYMTGFRMSFRTGVIRGPGFDDALRDYGLYEDVDASFTAARSGLVVAAWRAKIYHHRFPGARANGRALGLTEVLNMVYVVLKHSTAERLGADKSSAIRRRLAAFVPLRVIANLPGIRSRFGRERFAGSFSAALSARCMSQKGDMGLADAYRAIIARSAA